MLTGNLSSQHWFVLLGTGVLLFDFMHGLLTGSAILFYRKAKRSEDPLLYWVSMVVSGVLGMVGLFILIFDHK